MPHIVHTVNLFATIPKGVNTKQAPKTRCILKNSEYASKAVIDTKRERLREQISGRLA